MVFFNSGLDVGIEVLTEVLQEKFAMTRRISSYGNIGKKTSDQNNILSRPLFSVKPKFFIVIENTFLR